ncbi:MAG: hypothetical protein AAB733_00175 [Patescibacteria group bacterium]
MILYLNTTTRGQLDLQFFDARGECIRSVIGEKMALERVFERMRDFCGSDLNMLQGVIVVHGSRGSFSSIRVGVAIANALSYGLGIPVLGISNEHLDPATIQRAVQEVSQGSAIFHYAVARYDHPPKISSPKIVQ